MISSLHLDHEDDRRRGTSRANSVRFDESAMNHYGASSRQSMEMLPVRTGSGMGMSERSYSHRSDGRGSMTGLSMRANSFGLESSRLLGSSANSPRAAINPPPGFMFLGPVPSIIRCWLSDDFSTDSVLYAAVCSGSYVSTISSNVVQQLGLDRAVHNEAGVPKIKLSIYMTEATVLQSSSSRSNSPVPQVPAISGRVGIHECAENDKSIQVILGSDILRQYNGDVLFSEDRLLIFDDERNRLSVPLVRPESEQTYRSLVTVGSVRPGNIVRPFEPTPSKLSTNGQSVPGVIKPPPRFDLQNSVTTSPAPASPIVLPDANALDSTEQRKAESSGTQELIDQPRKSEDGKSLTGSGSEKSFTTSTAAAGMKTQTPGVWGNSWRSSASGNNNADSAAKSSASGYSRPGQGRSMKVLRPSTGKSMANATRAASGIVSTDSKNMDAQHQQVRRSSQTSLAETTKSATSTANSFKTTEPGSLPTKSNPIGQASAFGWLNSSGR